MGQASSAMKNLTLIFMMRPCKSTSVCLKWNQKKLKIFSVCLTSEVKARCPSRFHKRLLEDNGCFKEPGHMYLPISEQKNVDPFGISVSFPIWQKQERELRMRPIGAWLCQQCYLKAMSRYCSVSVRKMSG